MRDARLDGDLRRMDEVQAAVELPPSIAPEACAMAQIGVASGQALRIVAQFVLAQQTQRTAQTHQYAQVHEPIFQPLRALKAVVYQLAMAAQRVAEQQDDGRAGRKQQQAGPAEKAQGARHGAGQHGRQPKRW